VTGAGLREPAAGLLRSAFAVGAAWAAILFWTLGFRLPPGPETAGQWVTLLFCALFLVALHAGGVSLVAGFVARQRRGAGAARALAAILLALVYSTLALSLLKFVAVRSHLRWSDVRFVLGSLAQVAGEATATELRLLAFALLLPMVLACLFHWLLGRARRRADAIDLRAATLLLALGAAGLGALAVARVEGRFLLTRLVPEGAIATRWAERAGLAGELPPPDPTRQARIEPYRPARGYARWNVVVVMLESVPWRRVFGPDARPGTTPRLEALAAESVIFERAYAASVHSDYAQTSILASLYPRKSEQHDFFVDLDYPRLLPWDLLGPLGWRSAVESTQNERWGNMRAFLRTPALERFRHAPDFADAQRRGTNIETKAFEQSVVPDFLAWVGDERERPFVAYLNFQATHFPYVCPAGFAAPCAERDLPAGVTFVGYPPGATPQLLDRFHGALAYEDLWLGRLIDGLEELGAWRETALVVVADHGEAFYEHGLATHGTAFFDEEVRVPMLLRLPGIGPAIVEPPVSVLDALPTVYRAMGLPRPGAVQGHDDLLTLAPDAPPRAIPFTLQGMTNADGFVLGRFKWFVDHDRGVSALFDLASDPGERRNLAGREPQLVARLRGELDRFLAPQLGYYRARGWRDGWHPPRLP